MGRVTRARAHGREARGPVRSRRMGAAISQVVRAVAFGGFSPAPLSPPQAPARVEPHAAAPVGDSRRTKWACSGYALAAIHEPAHARFPCTLCHSVWTLDLWRARRSECSSSRRHDIQHRDGVVENPSLQASGPSRAAASWDPRYQTQHAHVQAGKGPSIVVRTSRSAVRSSREIMFHFQKND